MSEVLAGWYEANKDRLAFVEGEEQPDLRAARGTWASSMFALQTIGNLRGQHAVTKSQDFCTERHDGRWQAVTADAIKAQVKGGFAARADTCHHGMSGRFSV